VLRSGVGTHTEIAVTFHDETHYFDLTVEPLHDQKRVCVGLTCAATDITQLKLSVLDYERGLETSTGARRGEPTERAALHLCFCKRIKDEHDTWQVLET